MKRFSDFQIFRLSKLQKSIFNKEHELHELTQIIVRFVKFVFKRLFLCEKFQLSTFNFQRVRTHAYFFITKLREVVWPSAVWMRST